jgi:hypothetical protein
MQYARHLLGKAAEIGLEIVLRLLTLALLAIVARFIGIPDWLAIYLQAF